MSHFNTVFTINFYNQYIGTKLRSDANNKGVVVDSFYRSPEGMMFEAEASKILKPGDVILTIGGVDVTEAPLEKALAILTQSGRPIPIKFRKSQLKFQPPICYEEVIADQNKTSRFIQYVNRIGLMDALTKLLFLEEVRQFRQIDEESRPMECARIINKFLTNDAEQDVGVVNAFRIEGSVVLDFEEEIYKAAEKVNEELKKNVFDSFCLSPEYKEMRLSVDTVLSDRHYLNFLLAYYLETDNPNDISLYISIEYDLMKKYQENKVIECWEEGYLLFKKFLDDDASFKVSIVSKSMKEELNRLFDKDWRKKIEVPQHLPSLIDQYKAIKNTIKYNIQTDLYMPFTDSIFFERLCKELGVPTNANLEEEENERAKLREVREKEKEKERSSIDKPELTVDSLKESMSENDPGKILLDILSHNLSQDRENEEISDIPTPKSDHSVPLTPSQTQGKAVKSDNMTLHQLLEVTDLGPQFSLHYKGKDVIIRGDRGSNGLIEYSIGQVTFFKTVADEEANMEIKTIINLHSSDNDRMPPHIESFYCLDGQYISNKPIDPIIYDFMIGGGEGSRWSSVCLKVYNQEDICCLISNTNTPTEKNKDDDDKNKEELEEEEEPTPVLQRRESTIAYKYVAQGICILSEGPCYESMRKELVNFYENNKDSIVNAATDEDRKKIFSQLIGKTVTCNLPYLPNGGPQLRSGLEPLFSCLTIDQIIELYTSVLLEQRIVLVCTQYSLMTEIAEAIRCLIYPLEWCHIFAPVIPVSMIGSLDCPAPYIIGIAPTFVKNEIYYRMEVDTYNLDNQEINIFSSPEQPSRPKLPPTILRQLRGKLRNCVNPSYMSSDSLIPLQIQWGDSFPTNEYIFLKKIFLISSFFNIILLLNAFYEVTTTLLGNPYLYSLVMKDKKETAYLFDESCFLNRFGEDSVEFMRILLHTQAFSQYLTTTLSSTK